MYKVSIQSIRRTESYVFGVMCSELHPFYLSTCAHGAPFESPPLLTRAVPPTTFLTLTESNPRRERLLRARRLLTRLWYIFVPVVFVVVRPWYVFRDAAVGVNASHQEPRMILWSLAMTLWKPM